MIDVLRDPHLWLLLGIMVVIGAITLRITGEPWYDLAVRMIGIAAFVVALRWVQAVEPELAPR